MSFKGRRSSGMSSSRLIQGGHEKAKLGKHASAFAVARDNLTGGGTSKQVGAAVRTFTRNNAGKVGAVLTALLAVILAVSLAMPAGAAELTGDTKIDPDTTNDWTQYTRPDGSPSTQNVGRIWTDKSVFNEGYTFTSDDAGGLNGQTVGQGNSDFLVGLSALSSTSNLKEMVQTGKPLDIVLVLDDSGSMAYSFGEPLSSSELDTSKTYVIEQNYGILGTSYQEIYYDQDRGQWGYYTGLIFQRWESVNLNQTDVYQIRKNALQDAVNDFIDQTAEMNGTVSNENNKIQIGTVVFSSNASVEDRLTVCEDTGVDSLKQTINDLQANGGTNPGAAMESASDAFLQSREGAKKVVIFFTDGEPDPESNGYPAVTNAYNLKHGQNATIYTIGIFDGANPAADPAQNGTSMANVLMHAMSSNYPNATEWSRNQLGQRTPESDYYKTAADAGELDEVFQDIFDESTEDVNSGSPIEENSQQGNTQPGLLTFEDQLGNYMQVTGTGAGADKMQLAYGDQIFTSTEKTTDNNTMTVSQAYPVRLFYGVSLKDDAKKALSNPTSDDYAAIMASQKSADGKTVDFYSNNYAAGSADGFTAATFSPNAGNKFYYYTQDTTLYIDQDCETEATQWNIGRADTLYWKDTYWVQTANGGAEERSTGVAVNRDTAEWNAMDNTGGRDGYYYIPANTPRSDRPATMTSAKTDNITGTAANALNPAWVGDDVTQYLGNNGKLSFDMPGSLEIKKAVDWGNASTETQQSKNSFTFTVNLTDGEGTALTGEYPYCIDGASDQAGTVKNGGAITINGGQSVKIEDLPAGAQFTVMEQGANQNGFTTVDDSTAEGNDNTTDGSVSGAIVGGGNVSTTFTNTYKAADVNLSTNTTLKVKKDLRDRDWRDSDEFTFEIDGLGNTAGSGITTPEPADTTITVNSQTMDYTASFGDITFTAPGEYRYNITEDNDINPIAGIDYSGAIYRVVVTVTDNGTGNLEVSNVAIEQRTNDDGVENDPVVAVQGDTVTFVNKYDADGGTTNIDGTKDYTDTTGDNPINVDKFTFKIEALGGYDTDNQQTNPYTYGADEVPLPAGSDEDTHSKTVYNTGYDFTFGTITYSGDDINRTYEYKVTELAQNKSGQAEAGMTYDTNEYTVKVKVEEATDAEGTHIVATPDIAPENLVFTNTYDPTDVTLGANGVAPIQGTKTLDGRDILDDETFYFQLTQTDGPATSGGGFVTVLDQPETVTVVKNDMRDGSADFDFSNLTFSQVGTYKFTVNEVADDHGTETADGSGMTYDPNIATVTVKVSDNHDGKLKAEVTYSNDRHTDTTNKALFANSYEASMNYGAEGKGGINVTKQMLDRPMDNNEFSFTIAGADSDTVKADEANAKLAEADKSFQNTAAAEDTTATMAKLQNVSFDEGDAGKTFSYIVSETIPVDGDKLPNVTYDQSQYRVDIQVVDNGDSTMHTVTTVTKVKNSDGTEASEVVVDAANSDADDYAIPTFGFVNDYNPTPATVGEGATNQIQVTKKVEGADSATDYTFTLTATGDNIGNIGGLDDNNQLTVNTDGTIKNGESQTKTFGNLEFTAPGTYTFTVQENQPDEDAGWTFDDADGDGTTDTHTVTVVVTDLNGDNAYDGNLYIQSVIGSPVEITNSYEANPVIVGGDDAEQRITVQKNVTGHNTDADFSFKLEPADFDQNNEESVAHWSTVKAVDQNYDGLTAITDDFSDGDNHTASFGGIQFSAAGEFQFNIIEVEAHDGADDPAGWTYDTGTAKVTVKVTDNGEGQLEAEVVYGDKGVDTNDDTVADVAQFTNSYSASGSLEGDANGNLTVTKNYTSNLGDPWTPDDSFGFYLEADMSDADTKTAMDNGWIRLPDNAGTADAAGITITDTDTHQASFGDITFTEDGTYKFIVREIVPQDDDPDTEGVQNAGITYDTSAKTVTVNVEDNGDGTLTASVDEGSDDLTFNNTYNVQPAMFRAAYFQLQGDKVLDGRNWEQGDTFTFTMTAARGTDANGEQMANGVVEATMPDKTSDTIEPLANDGSWVSDNSAQFTFTDERYPGGDVVPDADDVFTYTQPGTYRYLIAETNPNASKPGSGILGVTYDQTQYRLTVVVKDDGNGNLVVESSSFSSRPTAGSGQFTDIAGDQGITFTNTYSTEQIGVSFNVAKVLEDRATPMADNEFMFHMEFAGWMTNDDSDAQSNNWSMDGEVAEKAPAPAVDKGNIVRGDVIFDNVTFKNENVGYTYRYAVTEVIPDDATNAAYEGITYAQANDEQKATAGWSKNGVTYDGSTKYLTAKVTSEQVEDTQQPGTYIEAVRVATGGEAPYNEQTGQFEGDAIFTNTYDAGDTTGDTGTAEDGAQLTKVLKGKAWDGDTFTFQIAPVSNTAGIEVDDMPMPAETQVDVDAANGKDAEGNDQATFGFGSITFDTEGTYVYKVTEVEGENAGITYDTDNEATVTITVTDNNDGTMTAAVTITNNVFTNEYASELDFAAGGGLEIVKTFENADMREFSFKVTPTDQASADKLDIDAAGETFTTKSGATIGNDNASHAEVAVIDAGAEAKFTQDDADDTYTYTVEEVPDTDDSVDYDQTKYTVTITTADDGQGGIKVTTTVTDGAGYSQSYVYDNDEQTEDPTAIVPFINTYKATGELGGNGDVKINATKTLTNRPMTDGEFTFNVTNVADPNKVVATGTNNADGTINFEPIDYSIDQMIEDVDNGLATPSVVDGKNTFTYQYEVAEDQSKFDDGVTAIAGSFVITVTVTDNGDGTLGIAVAYPDGSDGLTFRNAYGEGDTGKATLNVAGKKILDVQSGNNKPDITGKYTFTLTGEDEEGNKAPMPDTTTATNDAAGNVTFGDITYTMENVFGDTGAQEDAATNETNAQGSDDVVTGEATDEAATDEVTAESGAAANEADIDVQSAERTKTFTYTVTESGTVEGVDNDKQESKTFTVTVTDNGDGTISAVSNPEEGAKFSFTNTYSVDPVESSPTGEGGIAINKNLTGRDLTDDEFSFELIDDATNKVVANGSNNAEGVVEFETVKFTEPGEFTYTICETNNGLGGVEYDNAQYKATANVTDNGDGTLKVEWSFADVAGNPLDNGITFNNTYTAQPTSVSLGTGKLIKGRDLSAGEFTFKLADADGNEVSTATNEEDGAVTFDTITYDQAGTYNYTITEVAPEDTDPNTEGIQNNGVTYDESVYNVTVEVTDNSKGNLNAEVSYDTENGSAPLFVNTYTAPAEPEQGGDGEDGGLFGMAKTGDFTGGIFAAIAALVAAAVGGAAYAFRRMRRPRGRHAR